MKSRFGAVINLSGPFKGLVAIGVFCLLLTWSASAQSTDDCMACHEDPDMVSERDGRSVLLDLEKFQASIHGDLECVDCHMDLADFDDFPHEEKLEPVDCSMCHDDVSDIYSGSLHGQLAARGEKLAPQCWDCHGAHDIVGADHPESPVRKFNIPFMCGECHKEGTAVNQKYDIPEDSILFHYPQSIHGVGLYQQGLLVTAVCTDCHTAHNVRDHTDKQSSIHRDNVANTCKVCHGQIELVHRKVIRGELWEKEPDKVPVCVDCHSPHRIRRVSYEEGVSDAECMECHGNPSLSMTRDGETISLYVDSLEFHSSIHKTVACAQCHTNVFPNLKRACEKVASEVDCSICHSEVVTTYMTSSHGILADRGDPDAPSCVTCHGKHGMRAHTDKHSPTFPTAVPDLCGTCHQTGGVAALRAGKESGETVDNYRHSAHGKGLLESGLVVTAMCTDCHTAHHALPEDDPESSIHPDKIAETCAECHKGIYEQFQTSVHSPTANPTDQRQPTCRDCHASHSIVRADETDFRLTIMEQCGTCHEEVTESYFETFHGKVSKLGYSAAAQCYDCHGSHMIQSPDEPTSTLSRDNIVATCGQCHEGSHRQFAGYLTHATHHDKTKYPILYYTFWFMTTLLVTTLILAFTHTILWLPRSFQAMREARKLREKHRGKMQYQRFKPLHSRLHVMMVVSFLGLALTGMTLKFSYLPWAQALSDMLGGFESAGFIHRVCAIITFAYFIIHIWDLIRTKRKEGISWKKMIFNANSMVPNRTDLKELFGTLRWFIGLGPRPAYGRWTYWEKFDYFAVFWGVAVIGTTGLMLWFSETFTLFLPGWIINVATIVHSDEALLATAFIFTVHFFNTHFRPDKFPMDTVIFTGSVPVEELKEDRPREYAELMENQEILKHLVKPPSKQQEMAARIFGGVALFIGLTIIILIVYAEIFGYR